MSELKSNLVELSDAELNDVAGGTIVIGDVTGFAQDAFNSFFQKDTKVAQRTFAGPDGSGTESAALISEIKSAAGQMIVIG